MSDPIVPESRIFRIGRECYIVYLGKERDDVRPFLRIGNTREIPDEVHNVISTTVITDDHVGNPLLEILNVPKCQGFYLGDTKIVGTMKRFFKSFDLPTDEVTDYRKVKDGEKRHMVWFYSSGNIHLRYDEQVIFDLHKREKEDGHFVRLYEQAKKEFLRNPLRYIKQDFGGPGIILADGNCFWFEGGELLSFAAHPGFVAKLMDDGIDPDFITSSAYNLTDEDMDSHEAAVFIGFVKRMRQRNKSLKVLSSEPELLRKIRLLFPARGEIPATLEVTDVSGHKKATFRDAIVSRKDTTWMVHRAGLPEIAFGGKTETGVSVGIKEGNISVSSEKSSFAISPPRGFPINFLGHAFPANQLIEKYISSINGNLKNHFGEDEIHLTAVTEKVLKILNDDIRAGKASVSPLLKQTVQQVKDAAKKCNPKSGSPSWFFYANALTVADVLKNKADDGHALAKSADQIGEFLGTLLSKMGNPNPALPFWGDLYLEGSPRLFWKVAKRGFVSADVKATEEINNRIHEIASLNETPWKKDEERLLALIRSLGEGGEGPLSDEQIALLKKPEEERKEEEKARNKKEKSSESSGSSSADFTGRSESAEDLHGTDRTSTSGAASEKYGGKSGSNGKKRTWLWILLLLLFLLIGGFVAWDLSGSAPWGSVLRGTEKIEPGGPGTDGPGTDGSGTDGSGTDGTGTDGTGTDGTGTDGTDEAIIVDIDKAPRTPEEIKTYLTVDGVLISEADIHLAANEIAVVNGYKDLDYRVFTGIDPDWIYPGNHLEMPSGGDYQIRRGDTIWFLAARQVRLGVDEDKKAFDKAVDVLEEESSSGEEKSDAYNIIQRISEESKAEAMRRMAAEKLP